MKWYRTLYNNSQLKLIIENYSLVVHHKVVLVVDIYAVPIEVVAQDVMEA